MKTVRLALLFCVLFIAPRARGQAEGTVSHLDSLVRKLGSAVMANPQSVGLSIGVYENGRTHYFNFGTTERGKNSPPSEHTVYEIGSITKTFSGLLLAKAVLEKRVTLDDDIRMYLDGKYPNLQYQGRPVTLVHLANTTSGLPDWLPPLPDVLKKTSVDSASILRSEFYGKRTRGDFYDALHTVKLDTFPGCVRRHSNAGALLLAHILEGVYKAPFDHLVRKHVTEPVKMGSTGFLSSVSGVRLLAKGYNAKGTLMPYEFSTPYLSFSGGMSSSTSDMIAYIRLQLEDQDGFIRLSHERTVDVDAQTGKVVGLLPDSAVNAGVYSVGLCWFRYQYEHGKTQIWSDGGTSGFCSYLVLYPELKSGIILLSNESDAMIFGSLPGVAYEIFQTLQKQQKGSTAVQR